MIFTSESGLTDPSRLAEWDAWYRGHLAAMVAVPGVSSAQRFRALDDGPPPSLAMYTVASPAVFDSEIYLRTRGMGPFLPVVDQRLHRRNLFEGLDAAPEVPMGGILMLADRAAADPTAQVSSGCGPSPSTARPPIAALRFFGALRRHAPPPSVSVASSRSTPRSPNVSARRRQADRCTGQRPATAAAALCHALRRASGDRAALPPGSLGS
jgi:hypothetical protein